MAKAVKNSRSRSSTRGASKGGARGRGKADASRSAARKGERKGFVKFMRDVRVEMSKVTWPTRRDLAQSTLVVLVAVAIAGALIFIYDTAFSTVLDLIYPK